MLNQIYVKVLSSNKEREESHKYFLAAYYEFLAKAYSGKKEYKKTIECLGKALKIEPGNCDFFIHL